MDHLLVLTVAFVTVLVVAWVYMPDARRSFATAVSAVLTYLEIDGL